ncbi:MULTISPECIES: FtsQ-type POTRA domain-containing protein [unclassified Streptomyces]|uniref:cell division protein FtsQ/DivIB n=1 Tax=unclassified Streptomyces TaxID=2593676 RepID=UPI0006F4E81B|nr:MULTISPECIES: FtsQ-type POTRA domain-containing protein [unclassified Streptomyces]KQX53368.1 cell division protein FtsQ [Streptomyces sp. Root1304]KRA90286.1 cell division protein FtsQ [Streptomyces sp. Root66D1]
MAAGPTTAEKSGTSRSKGSSGGPSRTGTRNRRFRVPGTRTLLIAFGVLALVAGGIWALYGSSWFRVERVKTSGAEVLTPAEIEAVAAVPVGAPLVTVDTEAIEARLREGFPRIESVDVVRSWPHGIGLKVTERQPVLVIEKGGKFTEVDVTGMRFATVAKAPKGVPRLVLDTASSPSLRRFGADRLLREAVRVRGELPAEIARDTRVVRVTSYDSVTLELSRGRTVYWGSGEHGPVKARVLTALLKATPKAGHFDVSAPTAPASSGS